MKTKMETNTKIKICEIKLFRYSLTGIEYQSDNIFLVYIIYAKN